MNAIYLIQKDPKLVPKPRRPGDSVWESGFWSVPVATAKALIGGQIYFHKLQKSPAFFGGEIVGFEVTPEGEYAGRIIFRFRPDPNARGTKAGPDGWGMEKKIVWDEREAGGNSDPGVGA